MVSRMEGRRSVESAGDCGGAQYGFTLLAIGNLARKRVSARLVIEKDGGDYGFHVAAHVSAIVVELLNDTIQVVPARMARDQPLDELASAEWTYVSVVEDGIQGLLEILRTVILEVRAGWIGLAAPGRRQNNIVEQP